MKCVEIQTQLDMLLDGELAAGDEDVVFAHLATCKECRTYISTMSQAKAAMRGDQIEPPVSLDHKVSGIFDSHSRTRIRPIWLTRVAVPLPIVAAALLCLVALTVLLLREEPEPTERQTAVGKLVATERVEYLYVMPAVEVVGSDQINNGTIER